MKVYAIILFSCSTPIAGLVILCCLYTFEVCTKKKEKTRLSTYRDVELGQGTQTKDGAAVAAGEGDSSGGGGGDCGGGCGCDD